MNGVIGGGETGAIDGHDGAGWSVGGIKDTSQGHSGALSVNEGDLSEQFSGSGDDKRGGKDYRHQYYSPKNLSVGRILHLYIVPHCPRLVFTEDYTIIFEIIG